MYGAHVDFQRKLLLLYQLVAMVTVFVQIVYMCRLEVNPIMISTRFLTVFVDV